MSLLPARFAQQSAAQSQGLFVPLLPVARSRQRLNKLVRATVEPQTKQAGVNGAAAKSDSVGEEKAEAIDTSRINLIPKSRWPDGIPPVMGAHLLASGEVAKISTSKGPGMGGEPHLFYYPETEGNISVTQYASAAAGATGLMQQVFEASKAAIQAKGSFTLVLSGGSLLNALSPLATISGADFSKWHVFFVDERNVPHSSPDSTFLGADKAFFSKAPIPKSQIHAIAEGLPVKEAATEYAGQLLGLSQEVLPRNEAGWPVFDQMLLGVGPDGHIASLFPNHPQLAATEGWVLPVSDSPKPPPERITFSLPVINSAKEILMVAFGSGKAEIVHRALEVQALPGALPVQLVRPTAGELRWLLDCESAQALSVSKWEESKAYPRSTI